MEATPTNRASNGSGPSVIPSRIAASPWLVLVVLCLGFFMILLDTTIVNVAIPSMTVTLHASLDQVLWILNGYILVYAVLLVPSSWLGDTYGPRRMFMLGLVLFTIASAACGLSQTPLEAIIFRLIQGAGGAIMTPQTLSMVLTLFPPEKRGAAFGVWGAVAGVAAIAGPTLGGVLTTFLSWRAIFYVNVPVGILTLILGFLYMPELKIAERHRLDVVGILLLGSGLFLGVFGLIEGQRYAWGPISSAGSFSVGALRASLWSIPSILFLSVLLVVAFVFWESRQPNPIVPLSLFRDRDFSAGNFIALAVEFGLICIFLPMTLFLQSVLGLDALHAGFVFVPLALASTVLAPLSGNLTNRFSGKLIVGLGLICFAIGIFWMLEAASLYATGASFIPALLVAGAGLGATMAPMTTVAMQNIESAFAEAASGVLNTTRQIGAALGSAVSGAVLQSQLASDLHSQAILSSAKLPPVARAPFLASFASSTSGGLEVGRGQTGANLPQNVPPGLAHALARVATSVFQDAYLLAMRPTLALAIAGMLAGAVATLALRSHHPRHRHVFDNHHFYWGSPMHMLTAPRHLPHLVVPHATPAVPTVRAGAEAEMVP